MKRFVLAAAAALSMIVPGAASAATQVNVTSSSWAVGSQTGTLHFATSPFNNQSVGIGEFKLSGTNLSTVLAETYYTFCVDIFHSLSLPGVFDITPLSQMYTGARATNTFNVTSGAFWVDGGSSANARTLANTYLGNLNNWQVASDKTAMLLYSPTRQSQVFLAPVPEASTWAMLVFGFGVAGMAMRNRRRVGIAALV
jgi:PEP-CTERM motif